MLKTAAFGIFATLAVLILYTPAFGAKGSTELMVLYSNNVNGEIEPCG